MPFPLAAAGWGATIAVASVLVSFLSGNKGFAPGVCQRLEPYLLSQIVGQELAVQQFVDAACDHINQERPLRPLIISAHGPPGVGKSMMHRLAAQALYSKEPSGALDCPGRDCPGYKVLYGMDYISADRENQHNLLRAALLDHLRACPQSLIVVEEYDKLDCRTRGMFRQLFENSQVANISMARSIVLFESNTGYSELHKLVTDQDRFTVTAEDAQKVLKDLIYARWSVSGCEDHTDTMKMIGLVDFFLPFFPLERQHIMQLFDVQLKGWGRWLGSSARLLWDEGVLRFLTSKVDFDGDFPIEGAKEVSSIMTRHVSRPLRELLARRQSEQQLQQQRHAKGQDLAGSAVAERPVEVLRLQVAGDKLQVAGVH